MAKTHIPFTEKVLAVVTPVVGQAVGDYLTANPPTGGLTIEEIKADTQIDTAIDNAHTPGSDNQDLSGKVDKITGSSLVADSEIIKIHSNTLDHSHANNTTLNAIQEALTTVLKSGYDGAVTHAGSAHAPSNAQKNSDITKGEIEAVLTGELTSHSHASSGGLTQEQILRLI